MNIPKKAAWYLYIVRCDDGSLYTGITNDVQRRFREHAEQSHKCAKYLRGRDPLKLVYSVRVGNKSEALKKEIVIKKMPRAQKERLCRFPL